MGGGPIPGLIVGIPPIGGRGGRENDDEYCTVELAEGILYLAWRDLISSYKTNETKSHLL